MTRAARARNRRRRRVVLLVAPLLVVVPGVAAFAVLEAWQPRTPWTAAGAGPTTPPGAAGATPPVTPDVTPDAPDPSATGPSATEPSATGDETLTEPPGRGYDVDSPDSLTVVVNKRRPMSPLTYAPDDLVPVAGAAVTMRAEAAAAFADLRADAEEDGSPVVVHSATRSYEEQRRTFEGWVAQMGEDAAERASARAGHSEHQTGLAVDVVARGDACGVMTCFGETEASAWLVANAHRYGFVIRYDGAHEGWTGYKAEPWHLRYVGTEVAEAVHEAGDPSLEEFFGLEPAPEYVD